MTTTETDIQHLEDRVKQLEMLTLNLCAYTHRSQQAQQLKGTNELETVWSAINLIDQVSNHSTTLADPTYLFDDRALGQFSKYDGTDARSKLYSFLRFLVDSSSNQERVFEAAAIHFELPAQITYAKFQQMSHHDFVHKFR
jgi:hypothetical protein